MEILKTPLTYLEQIELLKNRNLLINDEDFAKKILSSINYYRLSAYGLGLHENNIYKDGVKFEDIYRLYEFDMKFKYILLEAIEKIEIMLRTKIAYHMAISYGNEAHLDSKLFQKEKFHKKFLADLEMEKQNQHNSAFVKHHNEVYGGRMPIWVAVELVSFGKLSHFFSNLLVEDQMTIAKEVKTKPIYLRSWLKSLVELRNICAHYGRVYNRIFTSTPKLYREHREIKEERIFALILVIKRLIDENSSRQKFFYKLQALIEEYEENINLSYIGFPFGWKKLLGEYIESK